MRRLPLIFLALMCIGSGDLYARSESDGTRRIITVVLCDKTGLNDKHRAEAKIQASRLIYSLKVDIEWFDSCEGVSKAEYVMLTLLPKAPPGWALNSSTMGRAVVLTGPFLRAYVFADAVKRLNDRRILGSTYAVLMGHAMAHELGHLIGVPHALYGIMKPEWGPKEKREALAGTLLFTHVR